MTQSAERIYALLVDANPVPDIDNVSPHLELVDSRKDDMQTLTRTRTEPAPPSRPRWRAPAVAAAVAAAVIAIGIAIFALGGDEGTPVDEIGAPPLETAEAWIESFEKGDIAGYEALMAPDAAFQCLECAYGDLDESGQYFPFRNDAEGVDAAILGASEGSLNATCSEDGSLVTCDIRVTSLFGFTGEDGQPANEYTAELVFTVEDGLITNYVHHAFTGNWFDYGLIDAYEAWLRAEDPTAHSELFFFGTMLTDEPAQLERHRNFVAQWAATR